MSRPVSVLEQQWYFPYLEVQNKDIIVCLESC